MCPTMQKHIILFLKNIPVRELNVSFTSLQVLNEWLKLISLPLSFREVESDCYAMYNTITVTIQSCFTSVVAVPPSLDAKLYMNESHSNSR